MNMRALWVATLIPLVTGCGHSESRWLERLVQPAELVGRYEGTPFAMESLRYAGYRKHLDPSEHSLTLSADGTCQVATVIDATSPGADGGGRWTLSGSPCRWESVPKLPRQTVDLRVGDDTLSFYLDKENGSLVLWQYAGDPDAWKYMELKRVVDSAG